ncbi:Fur family transcriptional regulator [Sulfurospirillum barnesii]|uniref:Fe2+/Zn2+ uptake regulation protein n=1 Tax=Sulfurospirillum barnesii (strain ATCC 700032 / DSM 10660 / SES-3) TaxID=760154 RepID=I3XV07_SULBS|nr:transcriptional repressor [Sulfurospirillum barnesii]AFL67781.1 Fe2+/Zn2+ uptake regulation protein [Sulfurospirillum barnesii SES-3]
MERFKDILKASNLKSTHQRLAILDCIERFGHVDIDTLYESITQKYPTMSKATLYRNINDLISFHILEEVKLPHQKQQYEIKKVPHVHLLCSQCGSVEDIFVETKALLETISSQSGFEINSSFIVMNGICRRCSGKK